MSNSVKERITTDLQQVKEQGKLRAERIREIVQTAVSEAMIEFKEGSGEIRQIVRDAVSAVIDNLKEKDRTRAQEEVNASIEGAIEGVSSSTYEKIAQTQSEIERLQAQIDRQQETLESEVDSALVAIEETEKESSPNLKELIEAVVAAFKEKHFAQLQEQYVKLKEQLAKIDATLANRYGDRYAEVKQRLENAKNWYDTTRAKTEAGEPDPVEQKRADFEAKAEKAGAAAAKMEQAVKEKVKTFLQSNPDKQ
ncbi:histidine kinase [Pleurocapsales cyanobacterium LEGE 06147]|nr:histidine kinase [Pleurocapsales cyanobacterium LEGE 06147]